MAKRLAAAAIGAAVSLLFVLGARYIPNLSISFHVLACLGTMIPLTKGYYREASLMSIAVILLGTILVGVVIVPYAIVGSLYTILTVMAYNKKVKYIFTLPVKIVYAGGAFYLFYELFSLITINTNNIPLLSSLDGTQLFCLLCIMFVILFILFDIIILNLYKYVCERFKRLLERI